jgi:hypothetical protein
VTVTLERPALSSEGAPASPHARPDQVYLRRFTVRGRRVRYGKPLLIGLAVVLLLFARVWENTVAHSTAMERDRLRRDVRALQNRLQLSSELSDQSTLLEGTDPRSLHALGFVAPDPSHIVDIDLREPFPRALPRNGVAARLSSWWRGLRGRSVEPIVPPGESMDAVPVRAQVGP